jgi:hypothetical protein
MIDHARRCIFIHQRKAAGSSIMAAFGMDGSMPDFHRYNTGAAGADWQGRRAPEDGYFVFSVVRNPFDRLVSAWRYLPDFRDRPLEWVLENLPRGGHDARHLSVTQAQMLRDPATGRLVADDLIRFESLQEGFDRVCDRLGMPRRELPRIKIGDRERDYRGYYSERSRALAERLFREDLACFNYSF